MRIVLIAYLLTVSSKSALASIFSPVPYGELGPLLTEDLVDRPSHFGFFHEISHSCASAGETVRRLQEHLAPLSAAVHAIVNFECKNGSGSGQWPLIDILLTPRTDLASQEMTRIMNSLAEGHYGIPIKMRAAKYISMRFETWACAELGCSRPDDVMKIHLVQAHYVDQTLKRLTKGLRSKASNIIFSRYILESAANLARLVSPRRFLHSPDRITAIIVGMFFKSEYVQIRTAGRLSVTGFDGKNSVTLSLNDEHELLKFDCYKYNRGTCKI